VQRYQVATGAASSDPLLALNAVEAASDIHLDVRSVPYQKLSALDSGEPSSAIRLRVETARTVQKERFAALGKAGVMVNGDMGGPPTGGLVRSAEILCLGRGLHSFAGGKNLMRAAVHQMDLSALAYHRVLKLSRTHRETAA
jgi:magnesium chelatase family protein